MNVVIPISILSFIFAFLASRDLYKKGLEACFFLLTFIGAIHYNYGNDYLNYLLMFQDAGNFSFSKDFSQLDFRDPGWILLCSLFKPLGFFSMVIFLNIIQNFIYYTIIKNYVEQKWWWLSVFIYVFSTHLYLINFSMMRQGLAISLIIASLFMMIKHRTIPAAIFVVLSSLIHSTSLIALPFLLFFSYLKNARFFLYTYLGLFVFMFLFGDSVFDFLLNLSFTESLEEYSSMYRFDSRIQFGVGLLVDIISLIVIVAVGIRSRYIDSMYLRLACYFGISYLLIPLQSVNLMAGRLGYYFSVSSIVVIPYFYQFLEKHAKLALLSLYVLIVIYRYQLFFKVGAFSESYSQPFTTIFSTSWK